MSSSSSPLLKLITRAVPPFPPESIHSPGWSPYPYAVGIQSPVLPPSFYVPHNLLSPTLTHDSSDSTPTLPSSASDRSSNSTTETDDIVVTMGEPTAYPAEANLQPDIELPRAKPAVPTPISIPHSTHGMALHGLPTAPQQHGAYYDPHQSTRGGRGRSQSLGKVKPKGISYRSA
jgi:hypothetical protein